MKGKQVETSSSSSSSSEDEEEDEDDDDDDSSDDDQSSSSTSDLDEELIKLINRWRRWSKGSMSRVCPSKFKISSSPIKEMSKERGCYGCGELGHFVEVCPNKPTPKTKKKACKDKALTSIRSWDDSSSEEEVHHKRRGHKHSSIRSCVPYGTR